MADFPILHNKRHYFICTAFYLMSKPNVQKRNITDTPDLPFLHQDLPGDTDTVSALDR